MAVTDYERNPPVKEHTTDYEKNPAKGEESSDGQRLREWIARRNEAEEDRKQYLPQVKVNRKFAAGKQHLDVNTRDGRVMDVKFRNGIKMVTADLLGGYIDNAVGRMIGTDYKVNFLAAQDNVMAEDMTKQLNAGYGWGWDNEWKGDSKILALWRALAVDGTVAVRVKYDRRFGEVVGEDVVFVDGKPIMDRDEERKYRAENYGKPLDTRTLREGKVVWEILYSENILVPPGFPDPEDFPWEIVCGPVSVEDLKVRYPAKKDQIHEEPLESGASLTSGLGFGDEKDVKLKGRVMVYTGYLRPCSEYPNGCVAIFSENTLFEHRDHLPFGDHPRGPSTGIHYFRWRVIPGRFWGRAFIEGGIGPQQIRNKRITQIDTIIDRNLPKVFAEEQSVTKPRTGEPMEVVEVRPGAPLPKADPGIPLGAWFMQDVKLQEENIERALGMRAITQGAPPAGITAYSALALLNENATLQLDPVAAEFRLVLNEVSWDTMEAMRNWPPGKTMLIAGPEDQLEAFEWEGRQIPEAYIVRQPRGGALPRTQAAELQLIDDIWAASGGKLPLEWLVESKRAGQAQPLPPSLGDEQLHRAELENITMAMTFESVPVAEYDDDIKHVQAHRAFMTPLQAMADQGDPSAMLQIQAFNTHLQEHEESSAKKNGVAPQGPDQVGSPLPPQMQPTGAQEIGATPPIPGIGTPPIPQG